MSEISEAYDRLLKSNVRFRFVVDMASMREPPR
jgi:D-arabinose 1-dehydrogenase-like Zn-dependent alcohol dehydrogenase